VKRYLLDTSVLSLLAPGRAGLPPALLDWFRAHGDQLFVSTITVAEIQQGISKLRRSGGEQRAELLSAWLRELIELGGDRIIDFDTEAALKAGEISDAALARGRHPGFPDVAIAAMGAAFDMEILTMNMRHFEPLEIAVADPSAAAFVDNH
jgi:predicted nucleic acid-binding protein